MTRRGEFDYTSILRPEREKLRVKIDRATNLLPEVDEVSVIGEIFLVTICLMQDHAGLPEAQQVLTYPG